MNTDNPCQTCEHKLECLERLRIGLDVKCKDDEHENYKQECKK